MHERLPDALSPLTSEDFDAMMNDGLEIEPSIKIPYGMDVFIVAPESESTQSLHCGIDTGDGDGSEDEYPPFHDPIAGGSIEELN